MDERNQRMPLDQDSINPDDRWVDEEWGSFELYEKKRIRERRNRLLFITAALSVFLVLCSVPVVEERSLKWKTLRIARDLAVEIEKLKTIAIQHKKAARMTFSDFNTLNVEIVSNCKANEKEKPESVMKQWTALDGVYKVLTVQDAKEFSIAYVESHVCFDSVEGLSNTYQKQVLVIVPVKDLSDRRLDRASYVIMEGESAKVSIN